MTTLNDLKEFKPKHNFFIGIDSDGTVFDTMETKHGYCFLNPLIDIFELSNFRNDVKRIWLGINLYSQYRGINRFEALSKFFKILKTKNILSKSNYEFPDLTIVDNLLKSKKPATNENLIDLINNEKIRNLDDSKKVIMWSNEVNKNIETKLKEPSTILGAFDAIRILSLKADLVVMSNTPNKTLRNDWKINNICSSISLICGQETGNKHEMLSMAINGKYDRNKVLMIGDSPSDYYAAKNNNVLFFPIIPGKEKESWEFLITKGANIFFSKKYIQKIQHKKILEFQSSINAKFI